MLDTAPPPTGKPLTGAIGAGRTGAGKGPGRRGTIVRLHRWLSLGAAVFWLIQAITGMLIVFHWELDDMAVAGAHRPTDPVAIERTMDRLAPPGSDRRITSIWTTAGQADRYNITVAETHTDRERAVRISGDGTVLRAQDKNVRGLPGTLVLIHHNLLSGDTGSWIVGISGLLLLSNLVLGLVAAWPKRRTWRRALTPARTGPMTARLYGWHRALGLWVVVPALATVSAGTMLVFQDGVAEIVGAKSVSVPALPADTTDFIPFSAAVRAAQAELPGSSLTAVTMPTAENPLYSIRLLAPDEMRRAYGMSRVYIDAVTGRSRGIFAANEAPWPRAFMESLFAFHTGEMGGLPGRLLMVAIGLWLTSMIVIGTLLWWRRR